MVKDVQGISLGSLEELTNGVDESRERVALGYTQDPEDGDPQVLVEREEVREIVAGAVGELPEKERLICSLYYYDELTMKEIGGVLGISESRVSQLHTKAMLRVRIQIEDRVGAAVA
jgi:RNA polymerase sigma factor for flagellar operon FliA